MIDFLMPKENIKQIQGDDMKQRWLLYQKLFLEKDEAGNLSE